MKKNEINIITFHRYINTDYILNYLLNTNSMCLILGPKELEFHNLIKKKVEYYHFKNTLDLNLKLLKILIHLNKNYYIKSLFIHELGFILFGFISFYVFRISKITYLGTDFFFYKKNLNNLKNKIKYLIENQIIKISYKVVHYSARNYKLRNIIYDLSLKKNIIFPLLISNAKKNTLKIENSVFFFGSFRYEIDINLIKKIILKIKNDNHQILFRKFGNSNSSYDKLFKNFCIESNISSDVVLIDNFGNLEEIRLKMQQNIAALYFIKKKFYNNYSFNFLPSKVLEYLYTNTPIICNVHTGVTAFYVNKYNLGKVISNDADEFFTAYSEIKKNRSFYVANIIKFVNNNRNLTSLKYVF